MNGNAVSRIALFSIIIFSTCLDRDSSSSFSMDRYFNKPRQKFDHEFTKLGPAVCVLGKSGIGKTWTVHKVLDPCIEITGDILKSKQDTVNFLERIRGTNMHVVIDDYESVCDFIGIREIIEPPTNGLFVVVSQIPVKFDFKIETYEFPVPTFQQIKEIVPDASDAVIRASHGDLRFVFRSLTGVPDTPDEFQSPKEFIMSLVDKKSKVNPANCIGCPLSEPGNMVSILHENYVDTARADADFLARIGEHLSDADVFDEKIYNGHWELFPYYGLFGCILPAVEIRHRLGSNLRPGSLWTKHQNMCMRAKRIHTVATRKPETKLSYDALCLVREYAYRQNIDVLRDYNIQPQDIDVLNYLSPYTKIKPKNVALLKKWLTSSATESTSTIL